jgi:hypothetical protein
MLVNSIQIQLLVLVGKKTTLKNIKFMLTEKEFLEKILEEQTNSRDVIDYVEIMLYKKYPSKKLNKLEKELLGLGFVVEGDYVYYYKINDTPLGVYVNTKNYIIEVYNNEEDELLEDFDGFINNQQYDNKDSFIIALKELISNPPKKRTFEITIDPYRLSAYSRDEAIEYWHEEGCHFSQTIVKEI